jgi:hypothetical protein
MKKIYAVALISLTVLTLLSLTLNGVVIFGLLRARQIALDVRQATLNTVTDARAIITSVGNDTFAYTLEVEQEIPIEASVPFNEEISVPVNTVIPIDTTVTVPIDLGITTYDLEVPIQAILPVDLEFTVPISQTIDIATTVPLNVAVPIEIPLDETPLVDYMEELDIGLGRLEADLEQLEEKLALPFGIGKD